MKRIAASVVVGVFLLTSVLVGTAGGHTFVSDTSLSRGKVPRGATDPGDRVIIFGRLKSPRPVCRSSKLVRLMRVRPGPDKVLARDWTDAEGDYRFVRHPSRDQTVYTRFSGTFFSNYGHSHRCLGSRSRNRVIRIN
jgi:hypothetical protein